MYVFFKQKTAYDLRISDWSSDVCSSDLREQPLALRRLQGIEREEEQPEQQPKIRIERPADRDARTVHSSAHRKGQTANDPMRVGCDVLPVDLVAASGQRTRHDRKSVVSGKSVSVRVDHGGRRGMKTQKNQTK